MLSGKGTAVGLRRFRQIVMANNGRMPDYTTLPGHSSDFIKRQPMQKTGSKAAANVSIAMDWETVCLGMLATVSSGVLLADDTGTIRHSNAALAKLFGYEPGELDGQHISVLMTPYDAQHHDRYMREFLKTRSSEIVGKGPREMIAQRKNGSNLAINISLQLVEMAGTPLFIAAMDESRDDISAADLSRAADHDLLTGLYNAYYLEQEFNRLLARVVRKQAEPSALLYLDVDQFRSVNDQFGHAGGDNLLIEYGSRIARRCRASDMAARLYSDKFAVLLFGIQEEFYTNVTDAFRGLLKEFQIEKSTVPVSVTAVLVPLVEALGDYRATIALAERHCKESKNKGPGQTILCHP